MRWEVAAVTGCRDIPPYVTCTVTLDITGDRTEGNHGGPVLQRPE